MYTFIALFRGINVGGNNLLRMKDLVSLMEDPGNQGGKGFGCNRYGEELALGFQDFDPGHKLR